jgi:Elongation factor Tu GTP binding domain
LAAARTVVLVDTPGIGSVYRHNTEAAHQALLDGDGAVLVLAADTPLSEREGALVRLLAQRRAPTFVVMNKSDHLRATELDQVRQFVEQVLCDDLGRTARVFAVSARAALADRLAGAPPGPAAGEFGAFAAELERFVADDLVAVRLGTARAELARLGASLCDALALERAAAELDAATLAERVERFRGEADRQRASFDDARTVLDRDVARIGAVLGDRLAVFARTAPGEHAERLAELAATTGRPRLVEVLRDGVETGVRASFEAFRQAEADRSEHAWQNLAGAFRAGTQQRVDAVRRAAAGLFAIPLPRATVPAVAEERERFFYLFLHVGGFNEPFGRLLGRLVPSVPARRQMLARAQAELPDEFDKHAGRARWDLTPRLDAVRRRFETAMRQELEDAVEAILAATAHAEALARAADAEPAIEAGQFERQAAVAASLAGLAEHRR